MFIHLYRTWRCRRRNSTRRRRASYRTPLAVERLQARQLMAADVATFVPVGEANGDDSLPADRDSSAAQKATDIAQATIDKSQPLGLADRGISIMASGTKTLDKHTYDVQPMDDRFRDVVTEAAQKLSPFWERGLKYKVSIGVVADIPSSHPNYVTLGRFHADGEFSIVLNEAALKGKTNDQILQTIIHEFGHLLAHVHYNAAHESVDDFYRDAYSNPQFRSFVQLQQFGLPTSSYGWTNVHEDYAEAFADYVLRPTKMQQEHPIRFAYFDHLLRTRVHSTERHAETP